MKTESNKFKGTVSHGDNDILLRSNLYRSQNTIFGLPFSYTGLNTTSTNATTTDTSTTDTPTANTSTAGSNLTSWLNFGENIATTLGGVATAIWGSNPAPTPQPAGDNNNNNSSGGSSAGLFIGLGLGALVLIILLVVLLKK